MLSVIRQPLVVGSLSITCRLLGLNSTSQFEGYSKSRSDQELKPTADYDRKIGTGLLVVKISLHLWILELKIIVTRCR